MSSLIEHVERAEVARWEAVLNEEPKCESSFHESDRTWHSGHGAYWLMAPCGRGGIRCARVIQGIREKGGTYCQTGCGGLHYLDALRIVEL